MQNEKCRKEKEKCLALRAVQDMQNEKCRKETSRTPSEKFGEQRMIKTIGKNGWITAMNQIDIGRI
jgi:hypothetical protein